ncbi:hypothetical protein ACHMWN_14490 [Pedobacter sp. UC225_61]|uniref:hypothetical protein n=1 Tax=Pedobacter sp. UC225_61 TaxID=3374623 RepID=UPI0037B2B6EC
MRIALAVLILGFLSINSQAQTNAPKSQWVYADVNSKLTYKALPTGDKIMDFSYAGYKGGGVSLPNLDVKITLKPSAGDNSETIQNAINTVSAMKLVNGFRGAVLLEAGTYNCEKQISITTSGVVLRGSGAGENGTIINLTGKPHLALLVRGDVSVKATSITSTFADGYVPSGTLSFNVNKVDGFKVGDTIRISKPVTEAWIAFMQMDKMVRDGKKQTWMNGEITTDRIITQIDKNKITVDVPLTDNYDLKYLNPGVTVTKINSNGMLYQIGIENFRIISAPQSVTITEGSNKAFTLSGVTDAWAKNIDVFNTVNSVSVTGKRITVENVNIVHNLPTIGAAKPADLNGSGQQILFNKCTIQGDNLFFFGTGAKVTGPVVLLNCVFKGNGWIQPHQRWATGLLVDNCEVPDGGIDFMNRGSMGSGHGWTIGWAVAWNSSAKSFLNQQPPGAANWVIGGKGEQQKRAIPFDTKPDLPEGIYDSYQHQVTPKSLYLTQLSERLGSSAVKNIGY